MNKMKDPNKKFVLFHDNITPNLKLVRAHALKETDFDGYEYSYDRNKEVEVWIKE